MTPEEQRRQEDLKFQATLKEKAGFGTSREMIAWARGQVLLGIGEGKFQTAMFEVMTTAITWGVELAKLNTPPVSGPLIRELETLREWKKQALDAVNGGDLGKYKGHPVADYLVAQKKSKIDPEFEKELRKYVNGTLDRLAALRKELDEGRLGRERGPTTIRAEVQSELAYIIEYAQQILTWISGGQSVVEWERSQKKAIGEKA